MTYGEAVNVDEMSKQQYLPEGLVEGCKLRRDIKRDAVLTYSDVELPAESLSRPAAGRAISAFSGRKMA